MESVLESVLALVSALVLEWVLALEWVSVWGWVLPQAWGRGLERECPHCCHSQPGGRERREQKA